MTSLPPGLTTWTVAWSDWVMRKRIRIPVEAAVAVRGEGCGPGGAVRVQAGGTATKRDPVEHQRVALEALGPGEGGDRGEDEEGEDQGGPAARPAGRLGEALSSPTITETGAPPETEAMSAVISRTLRDPQRGGDPVGLGGVAAFEHDDAVGEAGAAVGDRARAGSPCARPCRRMRGEAGHGRAVEHRHFDFARLQRRCADLPCRPCRRRCRSPA